MAAVTPTHQRVEQLKDLRQFFMTNDIGPDDAVVLMTEMIGAILETFSITDDSRAKARELNKSIEIMLRPQ